MFSYTWGTESATCVCTHLRATAVSVHTWEQLQLRLYTPEEQLLPLLCTSGEKFVLHLCSRRPPPLSRQPRAARTHQSRSKWREIQCCSVLHSVYCCYVFLYFISGERGLEEPLAYEWKLQQWIVLYVIVNVLPSNWWQ